MRPERIDATHKELQVTTPAGWYNDPQNPQQNRYFDGQQWTAQTAPLQGAVPVAGPGGPQPTQPWQGQAGQFQNQQYPGPGQVPQWGAPPKSNKTPLFIALGVVAALVLGAGAFWAVSSIGGSDDPKADETTSSKRDEKDDPTPTPSDDPSEEPSETPTDDPTTKPSDDSGAGLTYADFGVPQGYDCTDVANRYIELAAEHGETDRLLSATGLTELENNFGTVTQPTSGRNTIISCEGTGEWADGVTAPVFIEMVVDEVGDIYYRAEEP